MKKVVVSAPGKLHLSGEHAVVYGKPALVVATSLRLYVSLTEASQGVLLSKLRKNDTYLHTIVSAFEKKHRVTVSNSLRVSISSTVPVGSGMGSSAALAVSMAGALSMWHGFSWNLQVINDIAYQAEKVMHQNSSGSDPAIATHGGILWYRKELEFLKTLWLLSFKIPKTFTPLVLINTHRAETTGDLVSYVAKVKLRNEKKFQLLLDAMEDVTRKVARSIHDENEKEFREAIGMNEALLEHLEIVSPSVVSMIREIEKSGGVAKVSGAGGRKQGSGVVIALHDQPEKLLEIAKKHKHPSFQVLLGGEGAKMEQVLA